MWGARWWWLGALVQTRAWACKCVLRLWFGVCVRVCLTLPVRSTTRPILCCWCHVPDLTSQLSPSAVEQLADNFLAAARVVELAPDIPWHLAAGALKLPATLTDTDVASYLQLQRMGVPQHRTALMLVGPGAAGKTCLLKLLVQDRPIPTQSTKRGGVHIPRHEPATEGVLVAEWVPPPNSRDGAADARAQWRYQNRSGVGSSPYDSALCTWLEEAYLLDGEKSVVDLPFRGPLGERFEIDFDRARQTTVGSGFRRRIYRNGKRPPWPAQRATWLESRPADACQRIQTYDFAGQPVYLATHPLCFREEVLYAVCFNPTTTANRPDGEGGWSATKEQELWQFMTEVRVRSPACRMVVVATHADQQGDAEQRVAGAVFERMRRMFPDNVLAPLHRISSVDKDCGTGIDSLRQHIVAESADLHRSANSNFAKVPRVFLKLESELLVEATQLKRRGEPPVLDGAGFDAVCVRSGIAPRDVAPALQILQHWGSVLSLGGHLPEPVARAGGDRGRPAGTLLAIKPQWLFDLFALVVTPKLERRRFLSHAILEHWRLRRVLGLQMSGGSRSETAALPQSILALLHQTGVALPLVRPPYQVARDSLLPAMLTRCDPARVARLEADALARVGARAGAVAACELVIDFLPRDFMPKLIQALHGRVVWRKGDDGHLHLWQDACHFNIPDGGRDANRATEAIVVLQPLEPEPTRAGTHDPETAQLPPLLAADASGAADAPDPRGPLSPLPKVAVRIAACGDLACTMRGFVRACVERLTDVRRRHLLCLGCSLPRGRPQLYGDRLQLAVANRQPIACPGCGERLPTADLVPRALLALPQDAHDRKLDAMAVDLAVNARHLWFALMAWARRAWRGAKVAHHDTPLLWVLSPSLLPALAVAAERGSEGQQAAPPSAAAVPWCLVPLCEHVPEMGAFSVHVEWQAALPVAGVAPDVLARASGYLLRAYAAVQRLAPHAVPLDIGVVEEYLQRCAVGVDAAARPGPAPLFDRIREQMRTTCAAPAAMASYEYKRDTWRTVCRQHYEDLILPALASVSFSIDEVEAEQVQQRWAEVRWVATGEPCIPLTCPRASFQLEERFLAWLDASLAGASAEAEHCVRVDRAMASGELGAAWEELQRLFAVDQLEFRGGPFLASVTGSSSRDGQVKVELWRELQSDVLCEFPAAFRWHQLQDKLMPTGRVDVRAESATFRRVEAKVRESLPGAELVRLQRVQNRHLWKPFYAEVCGQRRQGNPTRPGLAGSRVQELWHATQAVDAICNSGKTGFDMTRAYNPGFWQTAKDLIGAGGHVYGYGAYFASHAVYSHWWATRHWFKDSFATQVQCAPLRWRKGVINHKQRTKANTDVFRVQTDDGGAECKITPPYIRPWTPADAPCCDPSRPLGVGDVVEICDRCVCDALELAPRVSHCACVCLCVCVCVVYVLCPRG